MHTPTPLILLGWFARIKENPLIDKKFSSLKEDDFSIYQ